MDESAHGDGDVNIGSGMLFDSPGWRCAVGDAIVLIQRIVDPPSHPVPGAPHWTSNVFGAPQPSSSRSRYHIKVAIPSSICLSQSSVGSALLSLHLLREQLSSYPVQISGAAAPLSPVCSPCLLRGRLHRSLQRWLPI